MSIIRKANLSDAMPLSHLAEKTFRATYGSLNTPENMENYCMSHFSNEIQAAEISNPNLITLLCLDNESFIGFAQLTWSKAPSCVAAKNPGEIQRLYVANNWHGKGIAQELMLACIEQFERTESDAIWLCVWEQNPRAISYYKKLGFVEVGNHVFRLGDDQQRDIVMVRPI